MFRKSAVTRSSRKAGSNTTFRLAHFASAWNTSRLPTLNVMESGSFGAIRQLEADRPQRPRALDQRLQLGLVAALDRDLGSQPVPNLPQLRLRCRVGGIELGGELQLDRRFLIALRRRQPAPPQVVFFGGANPDPVERHPGRAIVRIPAQGVGVFDDGAVEVRPPLRLLGQTHGAAAGAGGTEQAGGQDDDQRRPCVRGSCHC